jgi:putative transposase
MPMPFPTICALIHLSHGVKMWMEFYNQKRPHSALGGKPTAVVYWKRNETTNPDQQVQSVA